MYVVFFSIQNFILMVIFSFKSVTFSMFSRTEFEFILKEAFTKVFLLILLHFCTVEN